MAINYWPWVNAAPWADFSTTTANVGGVNQNNKTDVNKVPALDFSWYRFWAPAMWENTIDNNYIKMRNISVANQLANSGVNNVQWIYGSLKNIPWFKEASEEDKITTAKNIMWLIQSWEAKDPALVNIANKFNQTWQTDPWVANRFIPVANDYGQVSKSQNQILDFFRQYESAIKPYLENYTQSNKKIGDDVVGQLDWLKTQFMSQYGQDGEQRKRLNDYYSVVADNLALEQTKTANELDAQARQSWASLWATRAARSKAAADNLKLASEYKAKEVSDYDNLYKTVNTYMSDYIKAYGDSQDKYVKDTYAKMLEFKNQLGTALINSQAQLEQFKIQSALQDAAKTGISLKNS